ncbi:hypothetical protein ILUMI_08125 [Ignelater luminosus]|uniref:CLIP domain-containing serine protease n=1 Tax=Ignelater luminosus TaxID=2038154 RepID=A0A8K0GAY5_IGNLU|nr:hypothetical protein ILUMI_08125 [Ignelater luminosus]
MMCRRSLEIVFARLVILIIVAAVEVAQLDIQPDGPCRTPNGEKATCVSLFTCPVIFNAILTKNETAKKFAQLSRCGKNGKIPLVCCGSVAYLVDGVQDYIVGLFQLDSKEHRLQPSVINKFSKVKPVVFKEHDSKELPDRNLCGIHSSDDRILGGQWTAYDEFPWLVALESKRRSTGGDVDVRCGGSLINKKFVLTAAHCAADKEFELINVRLGEWNLTSDPDCSTCDRVQIVRIVEIIPHRYYNELSKNNDIALLRLEKEIEYTDFIRPVCLPPSNLPMAAKGTKLAISGWGTTGEGKPRSTIKLKVNVPLILNEDCNRKLPNRKVEANQMCAGGISGRDSCQGDSGGPLLRSFVDTIRGRVQWYQEGIISRGVHCGLRGHPGVYTRISRYISWIVYNIDPKINIVT